MITRIVKDCHKGLNTEYTSHPRFRPPSQIIFLMSTPSHYTLEGDVSDDIMCTLAKGAPSIVAISVL